MLSDDQIIERGGTQDDIDAIAHNNGACGAIYGGTCDYCGATDPYHPEMKDVQNLFVKLADEWNFPASWANSEQTLHDQMDDIHAEMVLAMTKKVKLYAQQYHRDKVRRKKLHYESNRLGLSQDDKKFFMDRPEIPRIVAAAVRKRGVVFTGVRHGYVIQSMVEVGFLKDMQKDQVVASEQGFIDQYGKYYPMEKARDVAIIAGQIKPNHGTLYSEDLW